MSWRECSCGWAIVAMLAAASGFDGMARGAAVAPREIRFSEGLAVPGPGRAARTTVPLDVVEAQRVRDAAWQPREGEAAGGTAERPRVWTRVEADAEGWFSGAALRGGHVWITQVAAQDETWILNAAGHSMVVVNGEPRVGDVYGYGYVQVPVALKAGTNTFLFTGIRGRLRARLVEPQAKIFFNAGDPTLPDVRMGSPAEAWGATVLVNATPTWQAGLELVARVGRRSEVTPLPSLPPLGLRKVGFVIPAVRGATGETQRLELSVRSRGTRGPVWAAVSHELRVRQPGQSYRDTFVSTLEGSVQYFAVQPGLGSVPASKAGAGGDALFLSLHGASVEAMGQADAYAPKRWGTLVAPTNRRPYGFDWEEWGRRDALEVLDLAVRRFAPDPDRIYLTGHSMGGHGTWSLGVTFPDRFAAVAPSAGWISFQTYVGTDAGTNGGAMEEMLRRAAASSDTLAQVTNLVHQGVYVIHGDADDNVPVREARRMREVLSGFHRDVDWHEQPGAGHWWDNSDEPGAECVDWPPAFDFFARHRRPAPAEVRRVRFTTVNPAVSSKAYWAAVEQQQRSLLPSRVDLQWDPGKARVRGGTENVRRLALNAGMLGAAGVEVELDGQALGRLAVPGGRAGSSAGQAWEPGGPGTLGLLRDDSGTWRVAGPLPAAEKGPRRGGGFKEAFQHRFVLVYGTQGTPGENAWALARARFDAEAFWYRGNGSVDVVSDVEFLREAPRDPDRGVVLYGHAELNAAWRMLLADSPVQVRRGAVVLSGREVRGDDLGCLFLRPRPDSAVASVAVVAGTGAVGQRVTERLPYFMAGTGYPDLLLLTPAAWEKGGTAVQTAGFFGWDWSWERGDWVGW